MAEIRQYINGNDFGESRDWEQLKIVIDWKNKKESGTISVSDLKFVDDANRYLQQRIMDGLNGGKGVFEGDPCRITIGDPSNPSFDFQGYLDFTDQLTVIGGEEIQCSLKTKKGNDWLADVADGFSFAYLYDKGTITDSDFVRVPYVINYVPDGMQLMILSMSIFMMTKELIENVDALSEAVAEIINASTPTVGVSVGVGAGVVTAWDLGDFIWAGLKVVARIIYIIAMVIAIKKLMDELFEQLLPKKRNHLGMTFRKMMERACDHLGLEFESSIVELDWVHIPSKDRKGGETGERGFPSNVSDIYTFGNLIRVLKRMFHADYRINNGVFRLERIDQFRVVGGYVLQSFFNNQDRLLQQFRLNTNEIVANYNIYWIFDTQDQNTLDDQTGRVFQAITRPINVENPEFVNIKNLAEVQIPFSQGKEKTELTAIEKVLKELAKVVDNLTGIFGNGTNYSSKIENRIGSLLLSSHFLTSGKVVVMNGSKLANNQREILRAKKLWDNFHFINSFALVNGKHNQCFIFEQQKVPMTELEFRMNLENNLFVDEFGNEIEIEFVEYSPFEGTAIVDFKIKKLYTNNLTIDYVE